MNPKTAKLLGALAVAAILAFTALVPSVAGVETWKILLALFGLFLVTIAGPKSRS
jgi:hypothetical protein